MPAHIVADASKQVVARNPLHESFLDIFHHPPFSCMAV
jgi:hypothetical protein